MPVDEQETNKQADAAFLTIHYRRCKLHSSRHPHHLHHRCLVRLKVCLLLNCNHWVDSSCVLTVAIVADIT